MTLTISTRNRTRILVISIAALVAVSAVIAVLVITSRPMSPDMPGMDHGAAAVPTSTPSPTMAGDMAGMDHGSAAVPTSTPSPTMAGDMAGMDHGSAEVPGKAHNDGAAGSPWKTPDHSHAVEVVPDQPLAAVLGTFGVGTGAVMVSAGALRHRDRARNRVKIAARAARRSQK